MTANLRLAWDGDHESLKTFVEDILQLEGNWSSPGGEKKVFINNNITIQWWKNKKVLAVEGKEANKTTCFLLKLINNRHEPVGHNITENIAVKATAATLQCKCVELSPDVEGIKLDMTILESKINHQINSIGEKLSKLSEDMAKKIGSYANPTPEEIPTANQQYSSDEQISTLSEGVTKKSGSCENPILIEIPVANQQQLSVVQSPTETCAETIDNTNHAKKLPNRNGNELFKQRQEEQIQEYRNKHRHRFSQRLPKPTLGCERSSNETHVSSTFQNVQAPIPGSKFRNVSAPATMYGLRKVTYHSSRKRIVPHKVNSMRPYGNESLFREQPTNKTHLHMRQAQMMDWRKYLQKVYQVTRS